MKTSIASWGVSLLLCGSAVPNNVAVKLEGHWDDALGIVKSCNEYEEREVTAEDSMRFVRPLLCEKALVFNVYNDTVVRSHHAINTTNVHFVVHPLATLTMKARVISMGRDEASTQPVVKVFGKVKFEARAWTASYANGTLEDSDGVVRVFRGGRFDSNQPVRFTTSAFVVANEQTRDEKESLSKLSPHLKDLLTEFHVRNRTKAGTPDSSGAASSTTTTTATTSTNGLGRSSISKIFSRSRRSVDTDASGGTHVGSRGVEAARKASREFSFPQNLTLECRVSKRIHELKMINLETKIDTNAVSKSNLPRGSENNHLTKNHTMLCPKDPWVRKPTCSLQVGETLTGPLRSPGGGSVLWPGVDGSLMFGRYQNTPSTEDSGGGEGAGAGTMQFATLLSSDSQIVRNVMGMRRSKVRTFNGKGGNNSEKKMGIVGGGFPLVQRPKKYCMGEMGTATDNAGSGSESTQNILAMLKKKVREEGGKSVDDSGSTMRSAGGWLPLVERAKSNRSVEIGTATENTDDDNSQDAGGKIGTAGGWLPWARRAEKNRFNEIGTEADKTGEVCASVSNKGCVKVTVDGITVLSKSGRYEWDWANRLPWIRPRDDGYEMHATEDGMEVRLGERTVWGIKADEWMG